MINYYAERIIKGEQILKRLSPEEEQGRLLGGSRNVEATIILGTENSSNKNVKRGYSREEQEVRLNGWYWSGRKFFLKQSLIKYKQRWKNR